MIPRKRLDRLLREIVHAIEFTPEEENLNKLLTRLATLRDEFPGSNRPAGDASDLADLFGDIQNEYAEPPVEERSLGRVLHRKGLDIFQSYRLVMAQKHAFSPKDERRRLKDAIRSLLEDGVRSSSELPD